AKESTFVVFTGFVPESVAVSIFSLEGKEVSCQHVFVNNGLGEIDLSGIKKGMYLIKTGLYDRVQKLIVY
ncbi:MAG: T9SS type A sorting domain-containing protein, partial [Bacteroidales bacterium]|nr:T9SS type A sorting domain-containing protein [Bacteroidales bacterium]